MRRWLPICALSLVGLSWVSPTWATEVAPSPLATAQNLTIGDILRLLKKSSLHAALQRSQVDVASADVVQARTYPNPNLSYNLLAGLKGPAYVNGTQHEVDISQPVLIAGQRGARTEAAEHGVAAARAHARADQHGLARDARALFTNLLAAQLRTQTLEEADATLQRAKQIVAGRAQSGMMSDYDLLRIDVEERTLRARLDTSHADENDIGGRLAVLIGIPELHPKAVGELTAETESPTVTQIESIPTVAAAREDDAAATARIDVAKRESWPTPVVGVGAMFTTSGFTLAGSIGVSTDLPLFDRGQGQIAHAETEAQSAHLSSQIATNEARAELARAEQVQKQRHSALQAFERDVAARLPTLQQMGEDAYKNGRGTILDLLDTSRTITETRLQEVDYREADVLAAIDVLAAKGLADVDQP